MCHSPLDTICLDGLLDYVQTASICAVSCSLQTGLGKIEGVSDKHRANTTESARKERLDRRGSLLLLLELLVLDGGRSLIVGHRENNRLEITRRRERKPARNGKTCKQNDGGCQPRGVLPRKFEVERLRLGLMVKKERDERRQRRGTTHDSRLWFQVWTGKRRQRPLPAKSQGGQAEAEAEVVCLSCQFPLQPTAIGLFFFFFSFFFSFFLGYPASRRS